MSTVTDKAIGVTKSEPKFFQVQNALLQVFVIFDGNNGEIQTNGGLFHVSCIGSKLDYSQMMAEVKQQTEFSGIVSQKMLCFDETDTRAPEKANIAVKNLAYALLSSDDISNVEIEVYVPTSGERSLSTLVLVEKLNDTYIKEGPKNENQDVITDKPQPNKNPHIKLCKTYEVIYIDNNGNSGSDVSEMPTSQEARVAAILCEYTYYICRIREFAHLKTIKETTAGKRVQHPIIGLPSKAMNSIKDSSIKKRALDTYNEIDGLNAFPSSWKQLLKSSIDETPGFSDLKKENRPIDVDSLDDVDIRNLHKELSRWDAITKDSTHWLNLNGKELVKWEDSLCKKILDEIVSDKDNRFSFVDNVGVLNKWLFLEGKGLASVLFVNEDANVVMYCTAGSDFGLDMLINGDWSTTNLLQVFTGLSPQYQQSVTNALILDRAIEAVKNKTGRNIKLLFIGHSLGGGLASNNAIVTKKRHAIIFNPAGLNWLRVAASLFLHNRKELLSSTHGRERVHSFIIKGEILDTIQAALSYAVTKAFVINGINFKPSVRSYSLDANTKYIESKKDGKWYNLFKHIGNSFSRHSMVNFLEPPSQMRKITIP